MKINSEISTGKVITINIDNNVFHILDLSKILVLYDGNEIDLADDYADVLNLYDEDVPEYLVLMGTGGIQVLLSIPHFSTQTILVIKKTVPIIFHRLNYLLSGIPIIGNVVNLLDNVIPSYGSLFFISIIVVVFISIVLVWIRRRKSFLAS